MAAPSTKRASAAIDLPSRISADLPSPATTTNNTTTMPAVPPTPPRKAPEKKSAPTAPLDPLDDPNFNPTEFINRLFPTEQSLSKIDTVLARLRAKIRRLEAEIREIVRSQTEAGERGKQELEEAKAAIQDLFEKMSHIKDKAEKSEEMVQEITRDIKSLDYAKRHLTTSITTLRRLNMLVSAVDQLQSLSTTQQYRQAASYLEAVLQLIESFKAYDRIAKIRELTIAVSRISENLKRQIFTDFQQSFRSSAELVGNATVLMDACQVVNILEPDFKVRIIEFYCNEVLREYRNIRDPDLSKLSNTNFRYDWLKITMKARSEDIQKVFPTEWKVQEIFAERFCDQTRLDLIAILPGPDVKVLLSILQKTVDFEAWLAKIFATRELAKENGEEDGADKDEEDPADAETPESLRQKYREFLKEKRKERAANLRSAQAKTKLVRNAKFIGLISSCFKPYLSYYIDAEEESLTELFALFAKRADVNKDEDGIQLTVFASSQDLFYFYRQSLIRCCKLSVGEPLLDLSKLFKKYLQKYIEFLSSKALPKDENRLVDETDLIDICRAINTTEYAADTTEQLENTLRKKIDPAFVNQIDFSKERDDFGSFLGEALRTLAKQVQNSCDPALTMMLKQSYNTMELFGDQSPYVAQIGANVLQRVPVIRSWIAKPSHFRSFCTKFAESLITRFIANIYKCKPISVFGAEQIRMDMTALRTMLIDLHSLGAERTEDTKLATTTPSAFKKYVDSSFAPAFSLLKVLLTPVETPITSETVQSLIQNYNFMFNDSNLSNFQKVLELKGLKRNEQTVFLEMFQKQVTTTPGDASTTTTTISMPAVSSTSTEQGGTSRLKDAAASVMKGLTDVSQVNRMFSTVSLNMKLNQKN